MDALQKPSVWFKLTISLRQMYVLKRERLPAKVTSSTVDLDFSSISTGEGGVPELWCTALMERSMRQEKWGMFESLANCFLPENSEVSLPCELRSSLGAFIGTIGTDRRLPENAHLQLDMMPKSFQGIHKEVYDKLFSEIRSFVEIFRWVEAAHGHPDPFSFIAFQWSLDNAEWQPMPSLRGKKPVKLRPLDRHQNGFETSSTLWQQANTEPLGHELVREALAIVYETPRSALLIGVSGLETGIKAHIAYLNPLSGILLGKMPSPPVVTMAQDVIPRLSKELNRTEAGFPLGGEVKEYLDNWIGRRNHITHGRKSTVIPGEVRSFLKVAQALLYRIDVCQGHQWAEPLITELLEEANEAFEV